MKSVALNVNPTAPSVYTNTGFNSIYTFLPIPGENFSYKTRPLYLYFLKSFTISSTYPGLMIFVQMGENSTNYGYNVKYMSKSSYIKDFIYEFISICPFGVDCSKYYQSDIDYEVTYLDFQGLAICNYISHATYDSQIISLAFTKSLQKTPKYFIAGIQPHTWRLGTVELGADLLTWTNRSYTLKFSTGYNTWFQEAFAYYFYSNWGRN